tara:strand:- start:1218 stop:1631 length:414 start_codon:yes stop_codon:yes gene_type:complete
MSTDRKTLNRNNNNVIVGGVCSLISQKYNFPSWILRTIFVVTSVIMTFPILIYLILWIIIPNRERKENKKRKYLLQTIGFFIGGIIGFFVGYGIGLLAIGGDKSGGIVVFIFALLGIPFGAIVGFAVSRMKFEKQSI